MSGRSKTSQQNEASGDWDLVSNELPDGWTATALGQFTHDISYGYTAKATDNDVGPKLLRITDIQNNAVNWNAVPFCEIDDHRIESYLLAPGDILFARTGATTGKSFLIKTCPNSVFASYLIRVRPSAAVLPEYLAGFFQTQDYRNQITENLSGSAQPNCNASKLASLTVPIAPIAEQRRIVEKLELLLGKVSSSQQRLSRIPSLLKRFRQSVLAAACSGKLTADWREENETDSRDWTIEPLQAVIRNLEQGWSPKCENFASDTEESWGVIKTTAIQHLSFDPSENKRLPDSLKPRPDLRIEQGDILITRAGQRVRAGVCCYVDKCRDRLILCDKAYRFRAIGSKAIGQFVALVLNSPLVLEEIETMKTGISDSGVNLTQQKFLKLVIHLPPLSEQQEIVRRVEKLFAFADQIEARLKQAQSHVDRLTQSLLAKAFRGELVPTEHALATAEGREYESASELLARIQADREKGIAPTKKTNRKLPRVSES